MGCAQCEACKNAIQGTKCANAMIGTQGQLIGRFLPREWPIKTLK